jgi:ubiquinone/menaquinone biosynthesis C-methylase UbiE
MTYHLARYPITKAICAALLLVSANAHAQVTAPAAPDAVQVIPPPLTEYKGRRIARTMHYTGAPWLIRESRQREEDCAKMLKHLGVKAGMTVCDMGCGNGFYTLQIAELVGDEGRVLAVDIQPEMLRLLKARAETRQADNIELILGDVVDPKLPAGKVDLILCVDVYHEFSHPEHMLAAMRESLAPDGRIVLVEFRAEDPEVPIKPLHKMSKKQIQKELTANGFKLAEQFDGLPWQHMMFFASDATQPAIDPGERDPD